MNNADYENMSAFSCGVKELDDFFRYEVKECVQFHHLSAYCVVNDSDEIIGVFTLMNDALMINSIDEKEDFFDDLRLELETNMVDFMNRQSSYPAINIGHLGISNLYHGHGIGTAIIDFVISTFEQFSLSGCQFVTVDALKNARTIQFYLNNGFSFQTNRDSHKSTRRMYRVLAFPDTSN